MDAMEEPIATREVKTVRLRAIVANGEPAGVRQIILTTGSGLVLHDVWVPWGGSQTIDAIQALNDDTSAALTRLKAEQ